MFKLKLTKGKTIFAIGPMELDAQDIIILLALVIFNLLLSVLIGSYSFIGLIVIGIIFRNILISKGQLKSKSK